MSEHEPKPQKVGEEKPKKKKVDPTDTVEYWQFIEDEIERRSLDRAMGWDYDASQDPEDLTTWMDRNYD